MIQMFGDRYTRPEGEGLKLKVLILEQPLILFAGSELGLYLNVLNSFGTTSDLTLGKNSTRRPVATNRIISIPKASPQV